MFDLGVRSIEQSRRQRLNIRTDTRESLRRVRREQAVVELYGELIGLKLDAPRDARMLREPLARLQCRDQNLPEALREIAGSGLLARICQPEPPVARIEVEVRFVCHQHRA